MPYEPLLPLLRALAEPTRLWMVRLLVEWAGPRTGPLQPGERGLCLTDIELAVGLPHPLVSHHLRILREAGVVESEKRGRWQGSPRPPGPASIAPPDPRFRARRLDGSKPRPRGMSDVVAHATGRRSP